MNIDQGKLEAILEAESWLRQATLFYKAWRYELGDDAVKRAKAALADPCFDHKPIFEGNREIPETVWVVNPLTNGKMLINGVDFDSEQHTLWEEKPTTTDSKKKSTS